MADANKDRVSLRIRFAGLCLFVPDPGLRRVHVLMPTTGQHAHAGHTQVPSHLARIHWVSGGAKQNQPLDHTSLVLDGVGGGAPDTDLDGVFDLGDVPPDEGCARGTPGTVDPATAPAFARLTLHTGRSRVVNRGAKWKIPGVSVKLGMPTVLDWWVRDVERDRLTTMLRGWPVLGGKLPDLDGRTMNLWVVHAPSAEHQPENIGSKHNQGDTTGHHFTAYYSLLTCGKYTAEPTDPELQTEVADPEPPNWPEKSALGMLISCMVAKAAIATESALPPDLTQGTEAQREQPEE